MFPRISSLSFLFIFSNFSILETRLVDEEFSAINPVLPSTIISSILESVVPITGMFKDCASIQVLGKLSTLDGDSTASEPFITG